MAKRKDEEKKKKEKTIKQNMNKRINYSPS